MPSNHAAKKDQGNFTPHIATGSVAQRMKPVLDEARVAAEREDLRVERMVVILEGVSSNGVETHVLVHGYWRAAARLTMEAAKVITEHEIGSNEVPKRLPGLGPEDPEQDPAAPGLKADYITYYEDRAGNDSVQFNFNHYGCHAWSRLASTIVGYVKDGNYMFCPGCDESYPLKHDALHDPEEFARRQTEAQEGPPPRHASAIIDDPDEAWGKGKNARD